MFSKATEIALRAVIYIAQKSTGEKKLGLDEIAKGIDSPKSFTAKILQKMTADNALVSSTRGPNGGFYLSDKNRKKPVRTIISIMEEDEVIDRCVLGLKQCSEARPCPIHAEYKLIKRQLFHLFETKTIQSLADEMKHGEVFVSSKLK